MPSFFPSLFGKNKKKRSESGDTELKYQTFCEEFRLSLVKTYEIFSEAATDASAASERKKQRAEKKEKIIGDAKETTDQLGNVIPGGQIASNVLKTLIELFGDIFTLWKDKTEETKQQEIKNFLRIRTIAPKTDLFSPLCQELAEKLYFHFELTINQLHRTPGEEGGVVKFAKFFAAAITKSLMERTITNEELKTKDLAVLLKAAIPSESNSVYYTDLLKKFPRKIERFKGDKKWSLVGVLLHAPGEIIWNKKIELSNTKVEDIYNPVRFHNLKEAHAYGYSVDDRKAFIPENPKDIKEEWFPLVKNWFSPDNYADHAYSPIRSSHLVHDKYDSDDWVFDKKAPALVKLNVTAEFKNSELTVFVEASFNPPPTKSPQSAQFRKFFQDRVSLTIELVEKEFSLKEDSLKRKLHDNSGEPILPTSSRKTSTRKYYFFGETTTTITPAPDYKLSSPNISTSQGNGTLISYHAKMGNCFKDGNACPYDTENPDGSMHVYFRAPDRLNEPAPSAEGCLTIKTEQTYSFKNVRGHEKTIPRDVHLNFKLSQNLIGMSIWRGVANHQMVNEAAWEAKCTVSLSSSPQITHFKFNDPIEKNIKDQHIKEELVDELKASPIVKIQWIKNDTFGRADLLPSSPLEKSSFSV